MFFIVIKQTVVENSKFTMGSVLFSPEIFCTTVRSKGFAWPSDFIPKLDGQCLASLVIISDSQAIVWYAPSVMKSTLSTPNTGTSGGMYAGR